MTTLTPGALFIIGGRPFVDSQTLHNLTRTHAVSTLAAGWRVQGQKGTIDCLLTSHAPLPEQRGALYEVRAAAGIKARDACATWLAHGAARIAGKYSDWPDAAACGCGSSCGCGPCKQRHGHAHTHGADDETEAQGSPTRKETAPW